jgi:hypothetical protein
MADTAQEHWLSVCIGQSKHSFNYNLPLKSSRLRGNKYGTPIYEAGSACSKCSDMNGRCDTTTQLCAV